MRDKHHPTGRKSLFFATLAHHPHLHPGQAAGLGRGGAPSWRLWEVLLPQDFSREATAATMEGKGLNLLT